MGLRWPAAWRRHRREAEVPHAGGTFGSLADLYERLVETMNDGLGVRDETGAITFVNRRLCEMTGYRPEELIGQPSEVLFDEENRKILARQASLRLKGRSEQYEIALLGRSGKLIPTLAAPQAIRDRDGTFRGSFAVFREISERKRSEEALRQSQELLTNVLESIGEGILVLDRDFHYTYWNRVMEEISGIDRRDVVGDPRPPWEMFPHLAEQGVDDMMRRSMAGASVHRDDIPYHLRDGRSGFTSESYLPLRTDTGEIRGIVGVVREVSARRRAEEERRALEAQMRESQKLESLGLLAGGVAHDFNNLLHGMMGNAELALHTSNDAATKPQLEAILRSARRAAELCQQLVAYSGRGQRTVERARLSEVVREVLRLLEVSIPKRVRLELQLAADDPVVEVDTTQVRQVAMNLIINAADAIGEATGVLRVSTGSQSCSRQDLARLHLGEQLPEGRYAWLEVDDDGSGMDAETRARMFDPFFSSKGAGRGLGLAAVVGIVRGHRGALRVHSQPGRGTSVRILLPACDDDAIAADADAAAAASEWRGQGLVLVIDDEEVVRAVSRDVLRLAGFEVLTASDGREGVEVFEAERDRVAAVLLDMSMPRLGGLETLAELKRIAPDVPVVLASGYYEDDGEAIRSRGAAAVLQKPFGRVELLAALRRALERPADRPE